MHKIGIAAAGVMLAVGCREGSGDDNLHDLMDEWCYDLSDSSDDGYKDGLSPAEVKRCDDYYNGRNTT